MFFFDPVYFLFVMPPLLLGFYAQWKVKSAFQEMSKVPARMSGAQAARRMLDNAGLSDVEIEQVGGKLSDHYDPRHKVLRLSSDVYNGQSMSAVGVACHEAGHAFQDAKGYAPLAIRNLAVPAANFWVQCRSTSAVRGLDFQFSRRSQSSVCCSLHVWFSFRSSICQWNSMPAVVLVRNSSRRESSLETKKSMWQRS